MVVVRCLLFSKSAKILHCIVFSFTAEHSVTGSPFSGTKMVLRDQKRTGPGMIGKTGHKDQRDDQRCRLLSGLVVLTLGLHTNDQGRNLFVDSHRIRIQWTLLPEDDLQLCQRSAPNQS